MAKGIPTKPERSKGGANSSKENKYCVQSDGVVLQIFNNPFGGINQESWSLFRSDKTLKSALQKYLRAIEVQYHIRSLQLTSSGVSFQKQKNMFSIFEDTLLISIRNFTVRFSGSHVRYFVDLDGIVNISASEPAIIATPVVSKILSVVVGTLGTGDISHISKQEELETQRKEVLSAIQSKHQSIVLTQTQIDALTQERDILAQDCQTLGVRLDAINVQIEQLMIPPVVDEGLADLMAQWCELNKESYQ
jgi:hypothetical protein